MTSHYGQGNSGPAREAWNAGDRVIWAVKGRDYGSRGTVAAPRRDPNASEAVQGVWVDWDDGVSGFVNANNIDVCLR